MPTWHSPPLNRSMAVRIQKWSILPDSRPQISRSVWSPAGFERYYLQYRAPVLFLCALFGWRIPAEATGVLLAPRDGPKRVLAHQAPYHSASAVCVYPKAIVCHEKSLLGPGSAVAPAPARWRAKNTGQFDSRGVQGSNTPL